MDPKIEMAHLELFLPVYYTTTPSNLHVELRHNVTDEMPIL